MNQEDSVNLTFLSPESHFITLTCKYLSGNVRSSTILQSKRVDVEIRAAICSHLTEFKPIVTCDGIDQIKDEWKSDVDYEIMN